ncbi:hypothetical protein ABTX77_36435 [Streptomyces sp. NPDC097704]|uniref:hypothetical protein n=1 Tax=Streptomyces sp. NPDC097704 TaxID=3157101 RepID=UPI00331D1127
MNAFRQYFEDNPEIFAALVAALAIVGSYLAGVRGAKIQANGGLDQAAAAREAAQIAAEAQRVAALWTVRQTQVAAFIEGVREVRHVSDLFYEQDVAASDLNAQLREAQKLLGRRRAEIELIVSEDVVVAAHEVIESLNRLVVLGRIAGPGEYFRLALNRQMFGDDPAESALARQAIDALDALRAAAEAGDVMTPSEQARMLRRAAQDVAATGASFATGAIVAGSAFTPGMAASVAEHRDDLDAKMAVLVDAARAMLRSGEDALATQDASLRRGLWQPAA